MATRSYAEIIRCPLSILLNATGVIPAQPATALYFNPFSETMRLMFSGTFAFRSLTDIFITTVLSNSFDHGRIISQILRLVNRKILFSLIFFLDYVRELDYNIGKETDYEDIREEARAVHMKRIIECDPAKAE